jgi:DnaJ-class molecular chaperone
MFPTVISCPRCSGFGVVTGRWRWEWPTLSLVRHLETCRVCAGRGYRAVWFRDHLEVQ